MYIRIYVYTPHTHPGSPIYVTISTPLLLCRRMFLLPPYCVAGMHVPNPCMRPTHACAQPMHVPTLCRIIKSDVRYRFVINIQGTLVQ